MALLYCLRHIRYFGCCILVCSEHPWLIIAPTIIVLLDVIQVIADHSQTENVESSSLTPMHLLNAQYQMYNAASHLICTRILHVIRRCLNLSQYILNFLPRQTDLSQFLANCQTYGCEPCFLFLSLFLSRSIVFVNVDFVFKNLLVNIIY